MSTNIYTAICLKCQNQFTKEIKWRHIPKYCSRSCANTRTHSTETKLKISKSTKANPPHGCIADQTLAYRTKISIERIYTNCKTCNKPFEHKINQKRVFCSIECKHKKQGGYQPNSTRKTRSVYKGFQMDSGSEKQFAELLDKHNIKWVKNSSIKFEYLPGKFYYPDFYLEDYNSWIEIKAKYYLRENDDLRWKSVPKHEVIWSNDIKLPSCI